MGGYLVEQIDIESLLALANEDYPEVKWTNFSETSEEHRAIWGWNEDGTYTVALAIKREINEVPDSLKRFQEEPENELGWYVKFISEAAGPVIEPPIEFIKTRPKLTIEGKRSIKRAQERRKEIEVLESIRSDADGKGVILSAVSCGDGRTFIWTTKGNYYIPESAYNSTMAMLGLLTIEYLKNTGVNVTRTIEERPACVYKR